MNFKQLEYFICVAELGSFTRASVQLNVAQPILSRRVRQLEVELHQSLLIRNGRGASLTDAGKLLLVQGRNILLQVTRVREELILMRGARTERVVIGLPPCVAKVLMVPLVRAFKERMPQIMLSITEGLSSNMREALLTAQLDVALLYDPTPCSELSLEPLLGDPLYLVQMLSPSTITNIPIRLENLVDFPLIMPRLPSAIRAQVESKLAMLGCKPVVALEIDEVQAALDLVAEGAGSTILNKRAVQNSCRPDDFVLRPFEEPGLRNILWIASSAVRPMSRAQQVAVELICSAVRRLMIEDVELMPKKVITTL